MDPRRAVAMTTIKALDIEPSPAATTPERLTASDVRAAVGMLRDRGERCPVYGDLLLLAFADNWVSRPALVEHYSAWMLARAGSWKSTAPIPRVVRVAIEEALFPPTCPRCGGRRYHVAARGRLHWVRCKLCERGRKPLAQKERAGAVGVSQSAWSKEWRARYERVLSEIRGDLSRAIGAMGTVLG